MRNETITLTIDQGVLDKYEEHYFTLHPRARKKPIPRPQHPSINQWMIMRRPAMNALKQKWKEFIVWFVENEGYSGLGLESFNVKTIAYYGTNHRRDADNTVPKFILDGLSESGIIVDDDSSHLHELTLKADIDKDHPRTEIIITKV